VVAVGRLFRVRGNRGELTGEIYSSQPGRAEKLKDVVLELADGKTRPSKIEEIWWHNGRPVFKFVGIDSISDAEQWAGADVLVEDS
jgi:ribosomal 30S subunit maturation factor RimM